MNVADAVGLHGESPMKCGSKLAPFVRSWRRTNCDCLKQVLVQEPEVRARKEPCCGFLFCFAVLLFCLAMFRLLH